MDLDKHSEGIWRSFFVYEIEDRPNPEQAARVIVDYLETHNTIGILDYSWCCYGETDKERGHITFRINFIDLPDVRSFRSFLRKSKIYYIEKNYDEDYWIKEAYCMGSKMEKAIRHSTIYSTFSKDFKERYLTLAIHGLLNDLGFGKGEEVELKLREIKALLGYGLEK